jgi:pimeloyl-ACP methyl ester carboxylesterase
MPSDRTPAKSPRNRLRVLDGRRSMLPARYAAKGPVAVRRSEVTLRGRRVAFRTGGWGPLLVLLHGIPSSSATWEPVLSGLARRYTVLAPDLLGHGDSEKRVEDHSIGAHANLVRDLMDALGYRQATFVGHSLGGVVAMQVAYQYPERVDRLVLAAPGGLGREISMVMRAAAMPGSGQLMSLAAWRPFVEAGSALAHLLGRLGLHAGTDLEQIGRVYAGMADNDARAASLGTLRAVVGRRGQRVGALPPLDVTAAHPSLIVWGDRDRVVPLRHGEQVHELVPHTYLAVFKGAGHFPHRDDPDRFVQVVNEFLAREWRLGARPDAGAALGA